MSENQSSPPPQLRRNVRDRRSIQAPNIPGNYPGDYVAVLQEKQLEYNADLTDIHRPKDVRRAIIAVDIRNFTKSVDIAGETKVQSLLAQFFSDASDTIHAIECAYINKYLGDGFFAHIDLDCNEDKAISQLVDASFSILGVFIGFRKKYGLKYANLSIAITLTDCKSTTVGGEQYYDYTLFGGNVNSLFRLLGSADGNIIFASREIKQRIMDTHHLVYCGSDSVKGIIDPISCYSIIRKKTEDELADHTEVKCSNGGSGCAFHYNLCSNAWKKGSTITDKHDVNMQLYCNECNDTSKCAEWENCQHKHYKMEDKGKCQCCHVCSNYRNCYNNYNLGREGSEMLSCDHVITFALSSPA